MELIDIKQKNLVPPNVEAQVKTFAIVVFPSTDPVQVEIGGFWFNKEAGQSQSLMLPSLDLTSQVVGSLQS